MTENERNIIIAKCAAILDKEASEWNQSFFDFVEIDDGQANYAMTKAMTFQDAAEMVRMLSPDYKAKKDEEHKKIQQWVKEIRAGNGGNMPNLKDN